MKGGSGISGAIGYILGTVVVVPLLLYLISIIFLRPNNVTENNIDKYINNTTEIQDNIKFEDYDSNNKKIGFRTRNITYFLSRTGSGTGNYYNYIYYSKLYKKYFCLSVIVEGGGVITDIVNNSIEGNDAKLTVNRDDYNNPAYGTIDNPVPVLKCIGVNKSIRYSNKDYDKAYMDKIFHDNVKIYLEYIMPKKEFKARYGN